MPEYERMWYSLLLGFGNSIEVLEPESVRQRLVKTAEEIINVYQNEKVLA
jgi:predicted DNA-binding transcriptional regulator YafY